MALIMWLSLKCSLRTTGSLSWLAFEELRETTILSPGVSILILRVLGAELDLVVDLAGVRSIAVGVSCAAEDGLNEDAIGAVDLVILDFLGDFLDDFSLLSDVGSSELLSSLDGEACFLICGSDLEFSSASASATACSSFTTSLDF